MTTPIIEPQKQIAVPIIHLNGTNANALLEQYLGAVVAVDAAIEVLRKVDFHGRDYYPKGEKYVGQAVDEHRARVWKLEAVKDELEKVAHAIARQAEEQATRKWRPA